MNTYFAADKFVLSNVEDTAEGYIVARNSNIARTGVQEYYAYELGLDKDSGMDPMKVIRLNRAPEDVFAPDSMRTFDRAPLTLDHPPKGVSSDNWSKLSKGDVHSPRPNGEFLTADEIYIRTKDAIAAYKSGKKQLSNGYSFSLDMTPGTNHLGERFDGSMKNIRGNHVALVDAARCGSACRIADSNLSTIGDSTMTTQKVTVDGIPLEVSDTAAAAINKIVAERDASKADLKAANDKLATTVTKEDHDKAVKAKDTEIEALKKDVLTPAQRDALVADWAKMTTDAKAMAPDISSAGKTCALLRKEVVASVIAKDAKAKATADAILGGKTVENADAETVRTVFNVLATTHAAAPAKQVKGSDSERISNSVAKQKQGSDATNADDGKPALVGRAAMMARQASAYQAK